MMIVKLNDSTVECSIQASELREIGLTPEAVVNGEQKTEDFMMHLNREVGQQLDFNPESEVLMMSKNVMFDGSVHISAVKMNNEDIQAAADRIRGAADQILKSMTQERVDAIKARNGKEKGAALNEMIEEVTNEIRSIYLREIPEEELKPEATTVPVTDFERYLTSFSNLKSAIRFAGVIRKLPIEDARFYKDHDMYYLSLGLRTRELADIYRMRKAGMEYAEEILVNAPEELHLQETADCLIAEDAVARLSALGGLHA